MRNKVAIYARLSREDEDKIDGNKESRSIENQIKVLSDYANEQSFEIYKVYYDDGYSGATMDRPSFQLLINDMKAHKFDILLVKDISRLGRSLHRVADFIDNVLPKYEIRLISVNDKFDSATYNGDESIVLRNFLNDYYLKDFRRKCKNARTHYAKTKHLNYYPKYGYNYDSDRKEYIDDYSAGIVRRIFDYIGNQGLSTPEVAEILNKEHIMTRSIYATQILGLKSLNKNPAKEWNAEKVWEIAKDYEYCGHSLNWVRHIKEEQVFIPNTHLAIIDEDLFARTQKIIGKRSTWKQRPHHIGKMIIDRETGGHLLYERSGNNYFFRDKKTLLRKYNISAKYLHEVIYQDVVNVITCCEKDENRFYHLFKQRLFNGKDYDSNKLQQKLGKLNDEYACLLEGYFNQTVAESVFEKRSNELLLNIKETELQLKDKENVQSKLSLFEIKFSKFMDSIKTMPQDVLDIIETCVSKIYINKVENRKNIDITIVYKFETD